MDEQYFDRLTKAFATAIDRRRMLKWAIAGAGATAAAATLEDANAQCGGTTAFCGGSNPPCCPGLQCAGTGGLMTCQGCGGAGAFCGGSNPSCCAGYTCTGPGPLTCTGNGGSWGDPHLTTFSGLMYDFQASGDFVLAQRDPDFLVQARQVPLGTNPDVAINNAVAARIADIEIAICLGDTPLIVEGQPVDLADRQMLFLPNGATVTRSGNRYVIAGKNGDSLSATVYDGNIDVAVGLGTESAKVGGLLGGPNDPLGIKTSDGNILTSPFPFDDLYSRYADGWRVDPSESLLSVCGAGADPSIPTKPFGAGDLDPEIGEPARDFCTQLEVAEGLLDACTLDVALMGDRAAGAYAGRPAPAQVGIVVP